LLSAVQTIEKQTPFVNTVIANAAIIGEVFNDPRNPNPSDITITRLQEKLWTLGGANAQSVLSINITGTFNTFVAFLPLLEQGNMHPASPSKHNGIQSQFITTTSCSGLKRGDASGHIYGMSKTAIIQLTKTLSTEYAKHGIRANSFAPGLFITEMTEEVKLSFPRGHIVDR
jgi:NAD(P)-dependent dehydrogenase (short-subunit alcohol dehydrogenase family)